ncbi:MAG: orotidine 5'-phosphate decarboxylase [Armatimonadetes bacterium]|jgi:3-hexulose-6-phosphate synthase/6-phospho-3-hexuloisomerase|nr:orotidine 5'-phosphate decarboxylase [Armatimonadota bacterium]
MDPIVQVSIDLMTLEDALPVAEIAVEAGVDWLEVGTPLILGEGLHAVRAFRERWPDHKVVADLKTMDAGYLEAEMMAKAGADLIVVMAAAHWSTVRGACRAAKDYGVQVMGDIMLAEDKPACARRMQELGVDYVIVHTGFDERNAEPGKSPIHDVPGVVEAVSIPVQAVGGLSVEQAIAMPKMGAPLVVIGAPLVIDGQEFAPGDTADRLLELLQHVVREVKAQGRED